MRRFSFGLTALLFAVLVSELRCQPVLAPPGWSVVERLKKGATVVVDRSLAPGEYDERKPCRVVRVDAASLVCTLQGEHGVRVVYPARQVAAVYLLKTHVSLSVEKMVLFGGAGWIAGGIITDDKWDYPLATAAAIAGGLYGLFSRPPEQRQTLLYVRAEEAKEALGSPPTSHPRQSFSFRTQ